MPAIKSPAWQMRRCNVTKLDMASSYAASEKCQRAALADPATMYSEWNMLLCTVMPVLDSCLEIDKDETTSGPDVLNPVLRL